MSTPSSGAIGLPPEFAALLPRQNAAPRAKAPAIDPSLAALLPSKQAPAAKGAVPDWVTADLSGKASAPRTQSNVPDWVTADLSPPSRGTANSSGALPPAFAALLPQGGGGNARTTAAPARSTDWRSLFFGPSEAALAIGSGTLGQIAGGLAGIGDLVRTHDPARAAAEVQRIQNALTYQPRTQGGQLGTRLIGLPFAELAKGADWAGGKVTDLTGSPGAGAAVNTAIQALPLLAGAKLPEFRDASVTSTPTVSPAVASARSIGLKLTPNQAQVPGDVIGRTVESLMGHAKLERNLSRPNAATVTRLAGREIGINGPVTRASVQAAKAAPNAVYAQVARLGNVPVDDAFRQQIAGISNPGAGSFAFDTPADIALLKEGYGALQNFDAGDAVAKVRQLRRDAGANINARYNPGQQALGHAQQAVADAIEGQLDRHVAATGGPSDLLSRYRDARTQLAKINTVSQALKAGKGQSVSALNLAKQLDRGAPLSGNLRTIAQAAQHFPRALQDLHKIRDAGPLSALDLKLEGGLGVLKPLAAVKAAPLLFGPPLIRKSLGSDLYQRAAFGPNAAPVPASGLALSGRALPFMAGGQQDGSSLAALLSQAHSPIEHLAYNLRRTATANGGGTP
jgi:hypothetical protein